MQQSARKSTPQPQTTEQQLGSSVVRGYRYRYLIALGLIAVLVSTSFMIVERVLGVQYEDSSTINIAGRQRMLSQKIAFYAGLYQQQLKTSDPAAPQLAAKLYDAAELMFASHEYLMGTDQPGKQSKSLRFLYFDGTPSLNGRVLRYTTTAMKLANVSLFGELEELELSLFTPEFSGQLLADLDAIVNQYETEAKAHSDTLFYIEFTVWMLAILVLLVEAIVIFRPMEKLLSKTIFALEAETKKAVNLQMESEKASVAKSRFLATVSHELRTPMNGMLGMLGLLNHSALNVKQKNQIDVALKSGSDLLALIDDILEVSQLDSDGIKLDQRNFNIRHELEHACLTLAEPAQEKGLGYILDFSGVNAEMVKGDPGRLRQIILNLVRNAIKFTGEGYVLVQAKLSERDDHYNLELSVKDTGIGIDKENFSKLFKLFGQLDSSTTRKYGGTGLGLVIAKHLAQAMEGDVTLESEPGVGSTFQCDVKLTRSNIEKNTSDSSYFSDVRVLLVDSNEFQRIAIENQLRAWGADVTVCTDDKEALALSDNQYTIQQACPFDLAIVDSSIKASTLGPELKKRAFLKPMVKVLMSPKGERSSRYKTLGFAENVSNPLVTDDYLSIRKLVFNDAYDTEENTTEAEPLIKDPGLTRILVVDDNQLNLEVAAGILEDEGFIVDTAADGEQAIEKLLSSGVGYSLVVMDCQMPIMDGFTATRHIRDGAAGYLSENIPILALTANALPADKEKCLASGMNDYLKKPIDPDEFVKTVATWLQRRPAELEQ